MPTKLTHDQYVQNLKIRKSKVFPIEKYKNMSTAILHICKVCGKEKIINPEIAYGNINGCSECSRKYITNKNAKKAIKKAENEYRKFLEDKPIILLENYIGAKESVKHQCTKCKNIWMVTPNNIKSRKSGCPECNRIKITEDLFNEKLKEMKIKAKYDVFISFTSKTKFFCTKCNNKFITEPSKIINHKHCLCKECSDTKRIKNTTKTDDWYKNKLKEKGIEIIPLDSYSKSHIKIMHKCICGNVWNVEPVNVLRGRTCGCSRKKKRKCNPNKIYSFHDKSVYKDRPTILYYIKVDDYYKIGLRIIQDKYHNIEDEILKGRFGNDAKTYQIEIIDYKVYEDGAYALMMENYILNKYKDVRYTGTDMHNFGGYTELFEKDIREYNINEKEKDNK